MTATTLIIDFNNAEERAELYGALKRLRGKHRVEICQHRKRRSDRQNRFYWPCFVAPFAAFLREQGEQITDLHAHEILKCKHLRRTWIDPKTGEAHDYTESTTRLTTVEFNRYLDDCAFWLADMFGIIVPEPSVYREKESENPSVHLDTPRAPG